MEEKKDFKKTENAGEQDRPKTNVGERGTSGGSQNVGQSQGGSRPGYAAGGQSGQTPERNVGAEGEEKLGEMGRKGSEQRRTDIEKEER